MKETTEKIAQLALINPDLHRPETCLVTWGTGLSFAGILTRAHTGHTMFLPDGTPVRARMLMEWSLDVEAERPR